MAVMQGWSQIASVMFSFFKKFTSKPAPPAAAPVRAAAPAKAAPVSKPASAAPATPPPAAPPSTEFLSVSLARVVEQWPDALKSRLLKPPQPSDIVQLDLKKLTEQLATGSIKLTFKEIRDHSPAGLFADSADAGTVMAEVPLKLIIPLLKSGQIKRRNDQKKSAIPEEIGPLFGSKGEPMRAVNGAAPVSNEPATIQPQSIRTPEPQVHSQVPVIPSISKPTELEISKPALVPAPAAVAPALDAGAAVIVAIDSLIGGWSGTAGQEFEQLRGGTLSIPFNEVESGVKRGKLLFTWGQLRNWIKAPGGSANLNVAQDKEFELPLKVVAPLFMAQKRPAKSQRKVSIGDNIPSLFSGGPGAAPSPAPAATALESPAMPREVSPATPPIPMPSAAPKLRSQLGEIFGQPDKHEWSPTEIVSKVSGLAGVLGALIVTPDGLLVAGQLPGGLSKENVAGFVPQMFGRIVQYTIELKPGETHQVTILLEKTALQIFKRGGLFFAVIGRDNESLPKSQLLAIANQLAPAPA